MGLGFPWVFWGFIGFRGLWVRGLGVRGLGVSGFRGLGFFMGFSRNFMGFYKALLGFIGLY